LQLLAEFKLIVSTFFGFFATQDFPLQIAFLIRLFQMVILDHIQNIIK